MVVASLMFANTSHRRRSIALSIFDHVRRWRHDPGWVAFRKSSLLQDRVHEIVDEVCGEGPCEFKVVRNCYVAVTEEVNEKVARWRISRGTGVDVMNVSFRRASIPGFELVH